MIKEGGNELASNLTSFQNISGIQSEKYFNGRKILGTETNLESKDSVDAFINKHSVVIENNVNTHYPSLSESSLASDARKIFEPCLSIVNPVPNFGNELLLSVLLNSNLKMNKLMYLLALDVHTEKQNRKLKHFIKQLRRKQNQEFAESDIKLVKNSSSSHLTCKFSSTFSNFYEENAKEISQLSTLTSSDWINKCTSKVELPIEKPTRPISKSTQSVSLSQHINKTFNKRVQEIYPDLIENHLSPIEIKSKSDLTTSESKEADLKKVTVDQPKSLEDIGNLIEKQITSINILISDFNKEINKEKEDILCSQHVKNKAGIDCNIAKRTKIYTNENTNRFIIDKHETIRRTSSSVFELHKTLEERNIYEKIGKEIKKIDKKNIPLDQSNILKNIEHKIDQLINSMQLLTVEIKEQKPKENENNTYMPDIKNKTEIECIAKQDKKIDTDNGLNLFSTEKYGTITQTSSYLLEMVKILENKRIKIKDEIERNVQANCYYGSTFKVSLTEKATEVTKSFSGTKVNVSEIIVAEANSVNRNLVNNRAEDLNNQSLNILALLKTCTHFVKQFLSCVPIIDYSYLGHRKFPHFKRKGDKEPNYVCNICQEVFYKASMLTDHIKEHDSGFARDCGVCNHILEKHKMDNGEQFQCQFCKKRFMRAYCCELHQQSCAKRFGLQHDVASNLILLR